LKLPSSALPIGLSCVSNLSPEKALLDALGVTKK